MIHQIISIKPPNESSPNSFENKVIPQDVQNNGDISVNTEQELVLEQQKVFF